MPERRVAIHHLWLLIARRIKGKESVARDGVAAAGSSTFQLSRLSLSSRFFLSIAIFLLTPGDCTPANWEEVFRPCVRETTDSSSEENVKFLSRLRVPWRRPGVTFREAKRTEQRENARSDKWKLKVNLSKSEIGLFSLWKIGGQRSRRRRSMRNGYCRKWSRMIAPQRDHSRGKAG